MNKPDATSITPAEDLSDLYPRKPSEDRHIFRRLSLDITDETLATYHLPHSCPETAVFFRHRGHDGGMVGRIDATYRGRKGDRIEIDGEPWFVVNVTIVFREEQWCAKLRVRREERS